ncbi:MAG: 3-phosphoshikimate 1-carboxyvinyltransferase [Brumimicrobium sp.]|nr:3-phosphoshikimate 1-carboxyvinyltransferase [Brumimicrobium sp.]MCO5268392.1 3-phosphoshikimate 1-carboxyvinyltransferase [Brumimicrobium sp.]
MNSHTLYPIEKVEGIVNIPPSKSMSQRVLALVTLAGIELDVLNLGNDRDTKAAIQICKEFGLTISQNKNVYHLKGIGKNYPFPTLIDCNESGLSTRLFSCFSLLNEEKFVVTGKGSILNRSMKMVVEGLEQFGKRVESNVDKLPLKISGKIDNSSVCIDGNVSSQFLTGLLLVSPFLPFTTTIRVRELKSIPYIQLTLQLLSEFGLTYSQNGWEEFIIKGNQTAHPIPKYIIEGDWSSASYFLVAGAIGGKVTLKGLSMNSNQADKSLLAVLENVGANLTWDEGNLTVQKDRLKSFEFDATNCPDLFPALVVLASVSEGVSVIKGVTRLYSKESNRAIALQQECAKIGVLITIDGDIMKVSGNKSLHIKEEVRFSSHQDHRIAMAMSLFSLFTTNNIVIEDASAVSKSYPSFFDDFRRS